MTDDTVQAVLNCLRLVEKIPESPERDDAIKEITGTLKESIRETIMLLCSIGEGLGFEFIDKTLDETKEMIDRLKEYRK